MENRIINISTVAEVAKALRNFKEQLVFVGGAVVSLYTDDAAADEIRPTKDIDLTLHILNYGHWDKIQANLAKLGFHPDPQGESICSFRYKNIPVDIISAEDDAFGPSNRWYQIGFQNLWTAKVKSEEIKIFSAPCYLATKFETYKDRGTDYRTSHDIEDVVYILDNRTNIVDEIKESNKKIREFIQDELLSIKQNGLMDEVLMAHIHPLMQEERLSMINEKIKAILED